MARAFTSRATWNGQPLPMGLEPYGLGYRFAKRKVGRVPEPLKITAHHPRLFRALAHMELGQEAARLVRAPLKTLAQIKVAMLIGCPF